MPKIKFIIHFFLKILHFKESCNLIGWRYFGPKLKNQNFVRYGIDGEISIKISVFILEYFQEKFTTKFFKKSKKPFLGGHFGPFLPITYHRAKNQKKLMSHSWKKCQTDRRTNRRTGNSDFMGPSVRTRYNKGLLYYFYFIDTNVSDKIRLWFTHVYWTVAKHIWC